MCILLISWNNKWTGDYCSHVCLPLNGPQMSNSHAFIIDRATCWVMNRDGVGVEGKCCASGPQCERRHMREKNGSYSLLKPLRHTKWVTWRMHDVGASYTLDTPVCVHTTSAILLLYLSHTHICVCVCGHSCKTKLAVSHSQAVETDLPQCVHCLMRGGGIKKEM